jgi:transcriptional regulator with XRE-family HTH domain
VLGDIPKPSELCRVSGRNGGQFTALGVSFQQVQKYEKGTNRLSATGLHQAAHLLQVPVSYFFDGVSSTASESVQEARAI